MSKIALIAKLTAAEDKTDELEEALRGIVAAAEEEAGLEVYAVSGDDDEPGTYYFFEVYEDADARAAHGKGDGMRAAMRAVGGLLGGRPEVITMTPIAAKGLDL